jgi:rhamnose utilization protein RhaD (predicted bifunctional aldolase and dehydrogenase)
MAITRDSDYPAEIGHLFQAFNRCCDGHSAETVLQASVNMVVAAINFIEQGSTGASRSGAVEQAETIAAQIVPLVKAQWDRAPSADDVTVPLAGN